MLSDLAGTLQDIFPAPPDPQATAIRSGAIPAAIVLLPLMIAWWKQRQQEPSTKPDASGPAWVAPLVIGVAVFAAMVGVSGWPRSILPAQGAARIGLIALIAGGFGFLDAWLPGRWYATGIPRAVGGAVVAGLLLEPIMASKVEPWLLWSTIGAVGVLGAVVTGFLDVALRATPGAGGPFAMVIPGALVGFVLFHSKYTATAEISGSLASAVIAAMLVGLVIRSMRLDRGGATTLALVYLAFGVLVAGWGPEKSGWGRYAAGSLVSIAPAAMALADAPKIKKWRGSARYLVRLLAPALVVVAAVLIARYTGGSSAAYEY